MEIGVFANALFLGEDYPKTYKQAIPDYVRLTAEDLAYMNGTANFFAMDAFTATVVTGLPDSFGSCLLSNGTSPFWPNCVETGQTNINGWQIGYASYTFVYVTPTYLRSYINWAWNTYKKPIVVSEYGYTVYDEATKPFLQQQYDSPRGTYYQSFLQAMLQAIWEDHCQVIGAWAWTFTDNWEWGDYKSQYGLQTVNRTSQERHYKKSFFDMVDYYNQRKSC